MALPTLTFNQFLANITNALAGYEITNLRPGSTAFAFAQAMSASDISLQQLMVHVANITRLATSYGTDVDTFVNDFGLTRLPLVLTSGTIFATRGLTGSSLTVPLGSVCQTLINQIQFQVIADSTQPNFDLPSQSYIFGTAQYTIPITVQAIVNVGTHPNIDANTLTQIVSGFGGVTSITNPQPFTNGSLQETDAELKTRFVEFIGSLAQATETAIEFAINTTQQGLTYQLIESATFSGAPYPGGFTVVVDDGTGNISGTLLSSITANILPIRAAGIVFQVLAPTNVNVNVNVVVVALPAYSQSAVQAQVQNNIVSYINTLGVGITCSFVNLAAAIQSTPGVMEYSGLNLNGGSTDVTILQTQLARAGSVSVT